MVQTSRSSVVNLTRLDKSGPTEVLIEPDVSALAEMAEHLGLAQLRKLKFSGHLTPVGREDWQLSAHLGATVVQPCVVSLEPVTTRIEQKVTRHYLHDFAEPEEAEAEMPEDDTDEALPERLDLQAVMLEALALALPDFPRAEGVDLGALEAAPPGAAPFEEAKENPFSVLAQIKEPDPE